MPQRPPDDLDRLLAEHAGPDVDALDTPEINTALDALGDRILAGETRELPRRRRRGAVVAASAALAAALAVGAPAAANLIGLHTGAFGLPGMTENDTSEFLRMDSPEMPALIDNYGRDYPLPPGGDYERVKESYRKTVADVGPTEIQDTGVRADVARVASCQWDVYWLDGYDRHDAAQQAAAQKVLDAIPSWEILKRTSDNGTDWEQRFAKAARTGNVPAFRYLYSVSCGRFAGRLDAARSSGGLLVEVPERGPMSDSARFEKMYREHRGPVLAFLLRRCAQPADAADALSDVFTTAWRRIDDIPDGDAERPWLFGVAYRTLANHSRSRRRRVRLVDELAVALRRFEQQPAETVVDSEALETALGRLSDIDRAIVTLTAWEQFNSAEIGAILDLSPGTVRTRLHRARARLRTAIESDSQRYAAPAS
jgi:RNA polymerase sigma-70 factor (ECF subfamily)